MHRPSDESNAAHSWGAISATGIATILRDTRGSDIDAACGQLAVSQV